MNDFEFAVEEFLNGFNICCRMARGSARGEAPSSTHCQRQQQLISQVKSHRSFAGQIFPNFLNHSSGHGFSANSALAETSEYLGEMFAFNFDEQHVSWPAGIFHFLD